MSDPHRAGLRVGLYGRVSIDTREGRSVDSQLEVGRRWAQQNRHHVVGEYRDDGISAYDNRKHRPAWRKVMGDLAAGRMDVLWIWELSRASRDREVYGELMKACSRAGVLISVNGKEHDVRRADDGFILDMGMAIAVRESAMISERVRRATDAAAEQGRPWGSIPFGYRREYDATSGLPVRQVPDETTGPVVREIVARVLAGDSLHGIAVDLNRRGVATPQMVRDARLNRVGVPRGGWNNPKLRKLLSSPTISGWRVHRGEPVREANWEPLVSVADHQAALGIINAEGRRTQRGTAAKHLLSGIATCGVCGGWLRHYSNRGRPAYGCNGRNGTGTGHVSRASAPLDALVVTAVVARLSDPGLLQAVATARAGEMDRAAEAQRRIGDLRARLGQAEQAAVAGSMSFEAFGRMEAQFAAQIRAAEQELARTSSLPAPVVGLAGPTAAELWDSPVVQGDVELQRLCVRSLLTITVFRSSQRGRRGFDASTVRAEPR